MPFLIGWIFIIFGFLQLLYISPGGFDPEYYQENIMGLLTVGYGMKLCLVDAWDMERRSDTKTSNR